jgi:phenylalanyl-tRNA synthetase beta chain
MKISYNWLKNYINTDLPPEKISELLTGSGLEVESLEKTGSVKGGLEGLVVGLVKTRMQHPNADRLSVTTVNIGQETDLQIVCGAPNVAEGQKVVVATVGSTLYPTGGEPFKISKSKIRGEISEGMICAEDEIGLGTDHNGIMILENGVAPGTPLKTYLKIEEDHVFEIGLTPNRGDAASHLGVARDLAALLKTKVKLPEVKEPVPVAPLLEVKVTIEDKEACPRYSGITISGITVKESPEWLKKRLKSIGLNPINNIVDITNFVLHELGQPIHAFDAEQVRGHKIIVKKMPAGTHFKTLDKTERILSGQELMICNAVEPMALAGVYGGLNSGVKLSTENIFIESAYFDPASIRRTAKHHKLNTDASFRYERGADPEITVYALKRVADLVLEIAGGHISSSIVDEYPAKIENKTVRLSFDNLNRIIGTEIPVETVREILEGLSIRIISGDTDSVTVSIPAFRSEVSREIDLIEEILRIYGYNNVPLPHYLKSSPTFSAKPDRELLRNKVAGFLSSIGFHEIITHSLVPDDAASETAVRMLNPLSIEMAALRQSMVPSGLEAIRYNSNRKMKDLKLFEFGKIYRLENGNYIEEDRLTIFVSGNRLPENWISPEKRSDMFYLKSVVEQLLNKLGITGTSLELAPTAEADPGAIIKKGDRTLLQYGKLKDNLRKKYDMAAEVYFADFSWEDLINAPSSSFKLDPVPKFPEVRRDLSLLLDRSTTYSEIEQLSKRTLKKSLKSMNVFDVYEGDRIESGKKSYSVSFILQDTEKTLTDKEIDEMMQKLIRIFELELKALIRK